MELTTLLLAFWKMLIETFPAIFTPSTVHFIQTECFPRVLPWGHRGLVTLCAATILYKIYRWLPDMVDARVPLVMKPHGPPSRDSYRIAILLSRRLPVELVIKILDMGEFWTDVHVRTAKMPLSVCPSLAGSTCLVGRFPRDFPGRRIRSVTFTIVSRDQGWTGDWHNHGTYRNSQTWFEAAVIPAPTEEQLANGYEPPYIRKATTGKRVVTNIHAGRCFKKHVVRWTFDDADEEASQFVRQVGPGTEVAVAMWTGSRAFTNYFLAGMLDCQISSVHRM